MYNHPQNDTKKCFQVIDDIEYIFPGFSLFYVFGVAICMYVYILIEGANICIYIYINTCTYMYIHLISCDTKHILTRMEILYNLPRKWESHSPRIVPATEKPKREHNPWQGMWCMANQKSLSKDPWALATESIARNIRIAFMSTLD